MDPVTASIIIGAIGSALNAAGGASAAGVTRDTAELQNQYENARQNQRIALSESAMDPFRQQMFQAQNLSRLALMGQPGSTGAAAPQGRYAKTAAPTLTPNTYSPSPELMQWLQMIQQNVAAGQNRAPSVTGWNGSAAMDLTDPATIADPRKAKGVNTAPAPPLYGNRPYQPPDGNGGYQ